MVSFTRFSYAFDWFKMNAIKMPQIVKFILGLLTFIVIVWLLFYFTIFLLFVTIVLIWIFYLNKFFNNFWEFFKNLFNKNNFYHTKKSENNSKNNFHIKEKFFLYVDKEFDQDISDAEIRK